MGTVDSGLLTAVLGLSVTNVSKSNLLKLIINQSNITQKIEQFILWTLT